MKAMTGAELIAAERQRQVEDEGWTAKHDSTHRAGELAAAALCYISHGHPVQFRVLDFDEVWPWDRYWWKPSKNGIRNLVKAGALIAAEIDRLQREEKRHAELVRKAQ